MAERVYSEAAVDLLVAADVAKQRGTNGSVVAMKRIAQHLECLRRAAAELELYKIGALEYVVTDDAGLELVITPYGLADGWRLRRSRREDVDE